MQSAECFLKPYECPTEATLGTMDLTRTQSKGMCAYIKEPDDMANPLAQKCPRRPLHSRMGTSINMALSKMTSTLQNRHNH